MATLIEEGKYELFSCYILTHMQEQIDVRNLMIEFDVYESMYSDSVTGTLILGDTLNLLANAPIIGGETVVFQFRTTGKFETRTHRFIVYSCTNRNVDKNKTQLYKLKLCTSEKYDDLNQSISRAINGHYSDSVVSILNEISDKPVVSDKSTGIHQYIIPYTTPFDAIRRLTQKSIDSDNNPFVFYESTVTGYNIRSVSALYEQEAVTTYIFSPSNTRPVEERYRNIKEYDVQQSNNVNKYNERFVNGGVMQTFDLFSKTYVEDNIVRDNSVVLDNSPVPDVYNKRRTRTKFQIDDMSTGRFDDFHKNSEAVMHRNYAMTWLLAGDENLVLGSVVNFDIPSLEEQTDVLKIDPLYSGRFLVSAIKHTWTKVEYSMNVEVVKNSFNRETGINNGR